MELPLLRGRARAAFAALRPRQWTKNALVFAGIVFAARTGDAGKWLEAVAAFATYCAASSAAYLLNDLRDVELDRLHPSKRLRPIARGELSDRAAASIALALVAVAVGLASLTGGNSRWMAVTIPFVVFGIGRYVLLIRGRGAGEEPEEVLLRDLPLLAAIVAWAAACTAILLTTSWR